MTHVLAETTITTSSYTAAAIAAPLFTANVPLAPPTSPPPLTAYPIPSLRPPPRAPAHLLPSGRCTLGDGLASCGAAQDRLYLGRRRVRRGIGVGVTGRHQDASCLSWRRGPIPPAPGARGAHPSYWYTVKKQRLRAPRPPKPPMLNAWHSFRHMPSHTAHTRGSTPTCHNEREHAPRCRGTQLAPITTKRGTI